MNSVTISFLSSIPVQPKPIIRRMRTRSCVELPTYTRNRLKIKEKEYVIDNDLEDSSEEVDEQNKKSKN